MDDCDIGTEPECFKGKRTTHKATRPCCKHADIVNRLPAGTAGDQHAFSFEGLSKDRPLGTEDDRFGICYLCLSLFDPRVDNPDTPCPETLQVPVDCRVMHCRNDQDRQSASQRSCCKCRNRGIVYTAGNFTDRVRGAGRNKEQVGRSTVATVHYMLHHTGDAGDRWPPAGVRQGLRGDDSGCGLTHHGLDNRTTPSQGMNQSDDIDCGDASGDCNNDLFFGKRLNRGHARYTSWTTCHACGRYFFTLCTWIVAEKPAPSACARICSSAGPMLWIWMMLPDAAWRNASGSMVTASKWPITIRS